MPSIHSFQCVKLTHWDQRYDHITNKYDYEFTFTTNITLEYRTLTPSQLFSFNESSFAPGKHHLYYKVTSTAPGRLKFVSDDNSKSIRDGNSKSISDDDSKSIFDGNSKFISDDNSKSISDGNSKSISDDNNKSISDDNSKSISDSNNKFISYDKSKSKSDYKNNSNPKCN